MTDKQLQSQHEWHASRSANYRRMTDEQLQTQIDNAFMLYTGHKINGLKTDATEMTLSLLWRACLNTGREQVYLDTIATVKKRIKDNTITMKG